MPWLDRFIRVRREKTIDTTRGIFTSWNIYGCALGYCCQLGISSVLLAWIPTYLLTVKKFSIMGMGFVAAAPWVGEVVGNILGGLLSDRFLGKRRKPGMMLSALATVGMMFALIHSPADPPLYAMLIFLTGMLLSIGYSAYSTRSGCSGRCRRRSRRSATTSSDGITALVRSIRSDAGCANSRAKSSR
ncbi:hypothetical protein R75777_07912 [Paraburkholderia nemoris]|nr:hypothetical protein R75777_07912 [Paraburkholderia nemoris]